ncbi:Xaa-Pro peptidase family protein [Prosthecochloris sp. HL-130-GSB]|jgi:Xaa-Pro aminopeptidase|uniref:Aminopeptidase P family protein n=1 Tax=Prosthecochloris aestuarii TaxID=1102 RepID=A0A831SMG0_PROAE|nr:Xaa-Pro peptidase family protein [Prosthecochloris sp. HL-130-GSB]ARM30408.1 peptidase M24 [Prosthecochloris sp. HL-130-GSB]MBO8092042.1 aminopeptidase P family protein [Prosthecochloris sp.]HED30351.1 aminopeptidase P family protein [Prosthecochloris aestuarii]
MSGNSWKLDMIRRKMAEKGLDAFFVSDLNTIRWLSGFSGSNAKILLSLNDALLFTDFRYSEQVRQEVSVMESRIVSGGFASELARYDFGPGNRMGVERDRMTLEEAEQLKKVFRKGRIVPLKGFFEEFRMIKDASEILMMQQAAAVSEKVLEKVLPMISPAVSEMDIAAEISYLHRKSGAEKDSFDPIVASGSRSALPHARPTTKKFRSGELIVIDLGCVCKGYASDQTRTVALGRVSSEARRIYGIVRDAQLLGLESAFEGMRARDLDRIVRDAIADKGYKAEFGHSLGHGVGVEVHEAPSVSSLSEHSLHESAVFTIEPGIYLPGCFGVRIEDTVVMRKDGAEPFQRFTKELVEL